MKLSKPFFALVCAASLPSSGFALPETFSIDPHHSTVGFKVKPLFSYVTGRFDQVAGTVVLDPKKPEASSVNVTISTGSINTSNAKRDTHLKSADFFEALKFPDLVFVSKSVKQTGADTAEVVGDLTMHGVKKEVPLKVHFLGKGPGMAPGEVRGGWEATTTLKRSEFGLTWSKLIEGTQVVGDDVAVALEIEGVRKPDAPGASP